MQGAGVWNQILFNGGGREGRSLDLISMKDLKRIKSKYYVVGQPIPEDFAYLFSD